MMADRGAQGLVVFLCHFSILCVTVSAVSPRLASEEERLLEFLFDGYNPSARPVINSSHTVSVTVQFSLLQLQELNLRNQVLTTSGLLILEWQDERLTWELSHIPLHDVAVEARELWRPEFASINGADGIYGDYGHFRALIDHTGKVHWEPGGVFKTGCEIDITYYPFDEQRCELVFGAWTYHTAKMNLSKQDVVVNMDSFEDNGEWQIFQTNVARDEFYFPSAPNKRFANVKFALYMRRRYTFYIMNVILPSLMTSVLLLSVFFCTPAQKVQIGVVVLLSFRIFLLNVTDSIPKTSDHIPLLGIYLTCTMSITTLSMVLTVFVLNLHHITDRPVPKWIKRLMLVYLARLLCMCHYHQTFDECNQTGDDLIKETRLGLQADNKHPGQYQSYFKHLANHQDSSHYYPVEEHWARDWRHLAEVVDRLFFWLFLLAIVVTTLILFHPLTKTYFSILGDETILGSNEQQQH